MKELTYAEKSMAVMDAYRAAQNRAHHYDSEAEKSYSTAYCADLRASAERERQLAARLLAWGQELSKLADEQHDRDHPFPERHVRDYGPDFKPNTP